MLGVKILLWNHLTRHFFNCYLDSPVCYILSLGMAKTVSRLLKFLQKTMSGSSTSNVSLKFKTSCAFIFKPLSWSIHLGTCLHQINAWSWQLKAEVIIVVEILLYWWDFWFRWRDWTSDDVCWSSGNIFVPWNILVSLTYLICTTGHLKHAN